MSVDLLGIGGFAVPTALAGYALYLNLGRRPKFVLSSQTMNEEKRAIPIARVLVSHSGRSTRVEAIEFEWASPGDDPGVTGGKVLAPFSLFEPMAISFQPFYDTWYPAFPSEGYLMQDGDSRSFFFHLQVVDPSWSTKQPERAEFKVRALVKAANRSKPYRTNEAAFQVATESR